MRFKKVKITLVNEERKTKRNLWARIPAGSDQVLITVEQATSCRQILCGKHKKPYRYDITGSYPRVAVTNFKTLLIEVNVKPNKVLDGFYLSLWDTGQGRLIKE